jgi:hypothetical protein
MWWHWRGEKKKFDKCNKTQKQSNIINFVHHGSQIYIQVKDLGVKGTLLR